MDLAGCSRRFCSLLDRPCPGFCLTGCQITDQSKQWIACLYQLIKTGFFYSKVFQKHFLFFVIQFCQLLLDLCTDNKYFWIKFFCIFFYFLNILIWCSIICYIVFAYICCENNRFPCKKVVFLDPTLFVLICYFKSLCKLAFLQMCFDTLLEIQLLCKHLIISCTSYRLCYSTIQNFDIGKDQLQINRFNITDRINRTIYMNNICIFKASDNMNDRIYLSDICKELVSKTFTLGSTLYKSCDIYKFNNCRSGLCWVIHLCQLV